jgi:DeoR family transcriptional regulator of aga operon
VPSPPSPDSGGYAIWAACGTTGLESEEAPAFRIMINQSKQTIAVADSSKIGIVTPALICPIPNVHVLITDTRASKKEAGPFLGHGIEVRRA